MGLFSRLSELFQSRAKKTEVIARLIPAHLADRKLATPFDFRNLADEGYRKNVIIYACIKVLIRAASEVRVQTLQWNKEGELEPVGMGNDLDNLLAKPNPEQSTYEWMEQFDLHYQTSGNAYIHKVRSGAGRVVELWNLRPDRVRIVPDAQGFVKNYLFPVNGSERRAVPLEPEDVIHLKQPDPLNDYYGLSPISVAASVGDLDNNAIKYLRVFFENRGIPGGFVKIKERVLNDEQKEKLKSQWHDRFSGEQGWHAIGILDADAEYIEVGADPQKLNLANVFGETESRICAAFGVPPIIVAVWIGLMRSTYANYETALKDLWTDTQVPKYRRFADKLTAGLASEFGENYHIDFDMSRVEALQENRDTLRKFALEGWKAQLLRRNQALELSGLPMEEGPEGEEYKPGGGGAGFFAAQPKEIMAKTLQPLQIGPGSKQVLDVDEPADEPEWRRIHKAANDKATEMRKAFMDAVRKTRARIDEAQLTKALDAGDPFAAFNEIPWDSVYTRELEEDFLELLRDVYLAAAGSTRIPERQSDAGPKEKHVKELDIPPELADEWAEFRVAELVREVGDNTKEAIRHIIERRFTEEGFTTRRAVKEIKAIVGLTRRQAESIDKFLEKLLKDGTDLDSAIEQAERKARATHRYRARLIARTEGIRAASAGQEAIWREGINRGLLPPEQEQFWIVTPDDRLDAIVCAPMEGQRRRIGEAFTTGDGRSVMAPPAHPACRCARGIVL